MNVAMLKTLVAIVDRGSFAAAAREVGCTPSAVSLQVKQLETWFGQLLFDRSARTREADAVRAGGGRASRAMSRRGSRPCARGRRSRVSGRVRLGAIATVQTGALAAGAARRARPPSRRCGSKSRSPIPTCCWRRSRRAASTRLCWCGRRRAARRAWSGRISPGSPSSCWCRPACRRRRRRSCCSASG